MTQSPVSDLRPAGQDNEPIAAAPDHWMAELGTLLTALDGPPLAPEAPRATDEATDAHLAKRRLGIASSLYAALQCKHEATARHAMRVALTCSAWSATMQQDELTREQLEIAALLHDIGVIGAPDNVLLKPGRLDHDEAAVMARARDMSIEILRQSCASTAILTIVEHVAAWYDGSSPGFALRGDGIPVAARMIAIAEAYDAMTTDRVYRPALSDERALAELFRCAGTQFDPHLVKQFVELRQGNRAQLHRDVAQRWLLALDPHVADSYWDLQHGTPPAPALELAGSLFPHKLLDNMYDAVVFVDAQGRITLWNHGAERLTGIVAAAIRMQRWTPDILNMADEKGRPVAESDCPVLIAITSGVQSLRRLTLWGRNARCVAVDCHTVPVISDDGKTQGAILLLHDASSEISLEQRCQTLAEKATRDSLTQVANRAELDRVHATFITAHQQQQAPCSLLMCDIDRFKSVNDTYGHQAGDEAIKSLSSLLKGACRAGDFVARYGGEEFVMLCADCDNAAASRRAEQIRTALAQVKQPSMNGRSITVSFGVTEIQPGDTPETMLRRADRALLMAKGNGRNQVVQLGTGLAAKPEESGATFFGQLRKPAQPTVLLEQTLVTPVPTKMAIEKLRGFVADREANILKIDGNQVQLEIADENPSRLRRLTDRGVLFQLDLRFEEQRVRREPSESEPLTAGVLRTRVFVSISPRKNRDRRRADVAERAQQVLASFRSYLMAVPEDQDGPPREGSFVKMKHVLIPWLGRK